MTMNKIASKRVKAKLVRLQGNRAVWFITCELGKSYKLQTIWDMRKEKKNVGLK